MPDRLAEIRARLDLAGTFSVDGPDNSHFINNAPSDIAWLLAENYRLQISIDSLRDEVEWHRSHALSGAASMQEDDDA